MPRERVIILVLIAVIVSGAGYRFWQGQGGNPGGQWEVLEPVEDDPGEPVGALSPGEGLEGPRLEEIIVHVAGAVRRPGVYHLPAGSRVYEAVERAGGVLEDAREGGVNQAAPLQDGQQVYIPRQGEEALPLPPPGSLSSPGKVNINTASQQELETLPGIGPARGQAIIREREKNGPFRSVDEITRVPGIGQVTLENLRDLVTT